LIFNFDNQKLHKRSIDSIEVNPLNQYASGGLNPEVIERFDGEIK